MLQHVTKDIFQYVMKDNEFKVYYQPIVSVGRGKIIGMESLLRASYHGEAISPEALFSFARNEKCLYALDTSCQKHAIKEYVAEERKALLFVNLEASLLQDYLQNLDHILTQIDSIGIARESVVIEINEHAAQDDEHLVGISQECKKAGFLVAMDDVGNKNSNLYRMLKVEPDIIKIDRSIISNIHENQIKQEEVRGLCQISRRIGAIAIAEGTETREEIVTCMLCGVDWFQGYFFDKPMPPQMINEQSYEDECRLLALEYKQRVDALRRKHMAEKEKKKKIFHKSFRLFRINKTQKPSQRLQKMVSLDNSIECAYILNKDGIQITDTVFSSFAKSRNHIMFTAMKKGDSHNTKAYYNRIIKGNNKAFISQPYVSQATGNLCRTISALYLGKYVICMDFFQKCLNDEKITKES